MQTEIILSEVQSWLTARLEERPPSGKAKVARTLDEFRAAHK